MPTLVLARWSFSLGAVLGAALSAAPPAAPVGRIEGRVVLAPSLAVRKPRLRPYADYGPGALPPPPAQDTNELANVVVYLDSAPGAGASEATSPPVLAQQNESFVPHVLAVEQGATVEFPNRDPVFHNVFSLSSTRSFDLGRYPKGESKSVHFPRAGIVQVFCHIHSDMSAIILVLENRYFGVPVADGRYAITDVPVGDYRLVAWHERIRPISREIRVEPGQTTMVDFTIPLPAEPSRRD